jgi:hypothetical protein
MMTEASGSWVNDFNLVSSSSSAVSIPKGKGGSHKKETSADKLRAELKLLEWHKLANDAAIKAALMQTKQLKASPSASPSHVESDVHWIRRVINNEQTKPLEVSRDYVLDYQKKEREANDRVEHQVHHHIDVLRSLRGKLEERAELRSRTAEFREWKKEFSEKKYAVLSGKTLEDFSRESKSQNVPNFSGSNSLALSGPAFNTAKRTKANELTTVLKSLEKLSELEERISSLEKDNAHDRMLSAESALATTEQDRLALEFRRKVKGDDGVKRAVYAVRERKKAWEVKPVKNGNTNKGITKNTRQGTFLTDVIEEDGDGGGGGHGISKTVREKQKIERLREQALAPAGKKNLKARVQAKKLRTKESHLSKKRHDDALAELKKRKADATKRSAKLPPITAKKGASAGIKTNNKYLQDFQKMKQNRVKAKEKPVKREQSQSADATRPSVGTNVKPSGTITRRSQTLPVRRQGAGGGIGIVDSNVIPVGAVGNGYNGVKVMKSGHSKW